MQVLVFSQIKTQPNCAHVLFPMPCSQCDEWVDEWVQWRSYDGDVQHPRALRYWLSRYSGRWWFFFCSSCRGRDTNLKSWHANADGGIAPAAAPWAPAAAPWATQLLLRGTSSCSLGTSSSSWQEAAFLRIVAAPRGTSFPRNRSCDRGTVRNHAFHATLGP